MSRDNANIWLKIAFCDIEKTANHFPQEWGRGDIWIEKYTKKREQSGKENITYRWEWIEIGGVEIMKTECLKSFRGLDNEACSFDEINTACLLTDGS